MIREPMGGWFVWNKTGHRPTHKHETYEAAAAEAQRLAIQTPGKKFVVLQMVAKFHEPAEARVTYDFSHILTEPALEAVDE